MRRARKQRPSAFLGAECNSGTTEKPWGAKPGAAEIEVKPSGVVRVLGKTTTGSHRPSHTRVNREDTSCESHPLRARLPDFSNPLLDN
jgi:hypothetical protein